MFIRLAIVHRKSLKRSLTLSGPKLYGRVPRPEKLPDLPHPELGLGLGGARQDEALAVAVDGERKGM